MKILIITGIFPPDIGGPATYVAYIARALVARGHQVRILTLADSRHLREPSRVPLMRIARSLPKPWRQLWTIIQLVISGRQADVLFVNGLFFEAMIANIVLRRPMVQKVVGDLVWERAVNAGRISVSFEEFQTRRFGFGIEMLRWIRKAWTAAADVVIVPSRYLARWVAAWGLPSEKLVVIYNAPAALRPPPVRPRLESGVNVITVARLVPWKGVDRVLTAVAALPDLGLVIVGDGPQRGVLEEQARRLSLDGRVSFIGQRPPDEVLGLLQACDIFVLNSSYEGLPHVVLEAMALGLPVLATPAGGIAEIINHGENGWFVDGSAGSLRTALATFAADPDLRERIGATAQRIVTEKFTSERMVGETESVLQRAAAMRMSTRG